MKPLSALLYSWYGRIFEPVGGLLLVPAAGDILVHSQLLTLCICCGVRLRGYPINTYEHTCERSNFEGACGLIKQRDNNGKQERILFLV